MAGPNIKDIAGLGEVVGHVKDFLLKIIETWTAREERRLRNESLRLKNTSKFLALSKRYHLTPEQLIHYENLVNSPPRARTETSRTGVTPTKIPESSPETTPFNTEYSKAQTLSRPY
jgi:hypothetical protein